MRPTKSLPTHFGFRLIGQSLCRLLPAPAGRWSFPTLSLRVFLSMSGPVPRCPARCSRPLLPLQRRPSPPASRGSANTFSHSKQLRVDPHFGAVIIRIPLQTSRFACHPDCPHPPGHKAGFRESSCLHLGYRLFSIPLSTPDCLRTRAWRRVLGAPVPVFCRMMTFRLSFPSLVPVSGDGVYVRAELKSLPS